MSLQMRLSGWRPDMSVTVGSLECAMLPPRCEAAEPHAYEITMEVSLLRCGWWLGLEPRKFAGLPHGTLLFVWNGGAPFPLAEGVLLWCVSKFTAVAESQPPSRSRRRLIIARFLKGEARATQDSSLAGNANLRTAMDALLSSRVLASLILFGFNFPVSSLR